MHLPLVDLAFAGMEYGRLTARLVTPKAFVAMVGGSLNARSVVGGTFVNTSGRGLNARIAVSKRPRQVWDGY